MSKKSRRKNQADARWPRSGSPEERTLQDRIAHFEAYRSALLDTPPQGMDELAALSAELNELATKPKLWQRMPLDQFRLLLLHQMVAFGADRDDSRVDTAADVYLVATDRTSSQARMALVHQVANLAGRYGLGIFSSLVSVAAAERDLAIMSTAAYYAAMLYDDAIEKRNMTGPEYIASIAPRMGLVRAGALARGVLMLGDQRSLRLIDRAWDYASGDGLEALTMAIAGQQYVASAEFYLRFLEAIPPEGFSFPCDGLVNMARAGGSRYPDFLDVERELPQTPANAEERTRVLRTLTKFEMAKEIEPRLQQALIAEGDYHPPSFMDDNIRSVAHALAAWGLPWQPNSPEEETLLRRAMRNA